MKKKFLSLIFLSFFSIINFTQDQAAPTNPATPASEDLNNSANEEQREILEQWLTQAREQLDSISFCLQQITQSIQARKISGTKKQLERFHNELLSIQSLTSMLNQKVLIQPNPDTVFFSIVLNNVLSKYLLKIIKEDPFLISTEKLNKILEQDIPKKLSLLKPEKCEKIIAQNRKIIEELVKTSDFIGLSWYNKSYRFLKQNNAYSIARAATVLTATAFTAGCIYYACDPSNPNKNAVKNLMSKAGHPGDFIKTPDGLLSIPDPQGQKTSGIYKFWDLYKTAIKYGIIGATPVLTLPLNDICKKLYYQYWLNLKKDIYKRWKRFDEICAGYDKKYDYDECEKVYFEDMTGVDHLKDLAKKLTNYMKHPERYERAKIQEHKAILLKGPPQTGKTSFVKALRTMITNNLDSDKKINFIDAKKILDVDPKATIDEIFDYAKHIAPCILFIDEIDLVGAHREKNPVTTGQLLTCMQGVDSASKKVIVIGATNKPEQLDKALLVDGRFGKIIHIDYPNYQERKIYIAKELAKRSIYFNDETFVDYISQQTEGASYETMQRIIMDAFILSSIEQKPVTQEHFEKALDEKIRKIERSNTNLPEEEKRVIAAHQAGKALMRHLLKTKQEIVKITIHPVTKEIKTNEFGWAIKTDSETKSENDKFSEPSKDLKIKDGEVFTKNSSTNHSLISDEESTKECYTFLAGNAAQKALLNTTFSKCNPHDRAEAMKIIYNLISQGEQVDKTIKAKALQIKDICEKDVVAILSEHKEMLEKITDELTEKNTIDRYRWEEIMKDYPTLTSDIKNITNL